MDCNRLTVANKSESVSLKTVDGHHTNQIMQPEPAWMAKDGKNYFDAD